MKTIFPPKLQSSDTIRIVAPSSSFGIISEENKQLALKRLHNLGFSVTFSKHIGEMDIFQSSSVSSRIEDLHEAFSDSSVKAIIASIGGFNANQLLRDLDFDLIRNNPKIFCGYSDITALSNALFAKTGLITYSGPAFANFAMQKGFEYTEKYFKQCLVENEAPFYIKASKKWSDDLWYKDQTNRAFFQNTGPYAIREGKAEGKIVGGNLCTLNLLQGTEYMPDISESILFLEDDDMEGKLTLKNFDRNLQSLLHLPESRSLRGIVFGRFQKASLVSKEIFVKSILTKSEIAHIPIIADMDFGHTSPMFTFPIGGTAQIISEYGSVGLRIVKH